MLREAFILSLWACRPAGLTIPVATKKTRTNRGRQERVLSTARISASKIMLAQEHVGIVQVLIPTPPIVAPSELPSGRLATIGQLSTRIRQLERPSLWRRQLLVKFCPTGTGTRPITPALCSTFMGLSQASCGVRCRVATSLAWITMSVGARGPPSEFSAGCQKFPTFPMRASQRATLLARRLTVPEALSAQGLQFAAEVRRVMIYRCTLPLEDIDFAVTKRGRASRSPFQDHAAAMNNTRHPTVAQPKTFRTLAACDS